MLRHRYRRNIFTDKLELVHDDPEAALEKINAASRAAAAKMSTKHPRRTAAWEGKDRIDRNMSVQPEQATPANIERLNANARHHGSGAYYDNNGNCYTPTRGSRAREMQARKSYNGLGFQDNDAGYSDYAGR